MKNQHTYAEAKVEILSKNNAVLLVDKQSVVDDSINFKYNDNVATVVAKNTANAKMGDIVKFSAQKKNLDLFIKIIYFSPLVFLLAGFLFALKFEQVLYQLVFGISVFIVGTLLSLVSIWVLSEINKPKFEIVEVIKSSEIAKTESETDSDNDAQNAVEENMEVKND